MKNAGFVTSSPSFAGFICDKVSSNLQMAVIMLVPVILITYGCHETANIYHLLFFDIQVQNFY